MPRDGFVTREHADGEARAREVFGQRIHVLLADHRAVKIVVYKAGIGRFTTDAEFYEWVNEHIGPYFESFPSWPAELKKETVELAIGCLETMGENLEQVATMAGRHKLKKRVKELGEQAKYFAQGMKKKLKDSE